MRIVENLIKAAEGTGPGARNHRIEYGRIKLMGSEKTNRYNCVCLYFSTCVRF